MCFSHQIIGPEDPRIVTLLDSKNPREFVFFSCDFKEQGVWKIGTFFSPLHDWSARKLLLLPDIQARKWEKNWTPWVKENKLYISYTLAPKHRVYELNPVSGQLSFVSETEGAYKKSISGGTNAIVYRDVMLGIAHVRETVKWSGLVLPNMVNSKYLMMFYEFEQTMPFKMRRVSRSFCFNHLPRVEFPVGLVEMADGRLMVSYGESDVQTKVVVVEYKNIPW
jgi:predicted GH43/DUF377 family glycosyl hydrolase